MISCNILFDKEDQPIAPDEISNTISDFGTGYIKAVADITSQSMVLDKRGEKFVYCASRILRSFGMTRSGPFKVGLENKLLICWNEIREEILELKSLIGEIESIRERILIASTKKQREEVISKVWIVTKSLLPITMGKHTYGLVAASKILFSVLPEIVLPVDNVQWKSLFKTVDIGDVIHFMVDDIQKWETVTGKQFHLLDNSGQLTTLPSIYNVVAMNARPLSI